MPHRAQFDIVVVADFSIGDTGAAQSVALCRALAAAGYCIGALQWFGATRKEPTNLDPGLAKLVASGAVHRLSIHACASAGLVLAADARLFRFRAARPADIQAPHRVVICPRFVAGSPGDLGHVIDHAQEGLGGEITFAPVAAQMRDHLVSLKPDCPVTDDDWPPVVERRDRLTPTGGLTDRPTLPMLGYFRAAPVRPWPEDVAGLRAVLPDHPLLGLAAYAAPKHFVDELAGGQGPVSFWQPDVGDHRAFLSAVDGVTAQDNPLEAPYPPELLAALEVGTIPIISPNFRQIFLSAAIYAAPEALAETAIELFLNDALKEDIRAAIDETIDWQLAPRHLVARVDAIIGKPGAPALHSASVQRPDRRVLCLTTNGIGMGHLTRQLAIADRQDPSISTVFIGMSQAVSVVRQFGYLSQYIQYHTSIGLNWHYWNLCLAQTLENAVRFYRPAAFVLDANIPFPALEALRDSHPNLPMIWVRRAMWRAGRDAAALEKAPMFEAVIEPQEIAAAYDSGPTVDVRRGARVVPPITLLEPNEVMDRPAACKALDLDPGWTNVLILPGGLNNVEGAAFWADVVAQALAQPRTSVVVGEWLMSEAEVDWPAGVRVLKAFPFATWMRAFDFAVSACGYNSFSELCQFALPTIFVPNENPLMDRQDLRAAFAERRRMGLHVTLGDSFAMTRSLAQMAAPETRAEFAANLAALGLRNGAYDAAEVIAGWALGGIAHHERAWS